VSDGGSFRRGQQRIHAGGGLQRSWFDAGMRAVESGRGQQRLRKWVAAEESGEVLGHLIVEVLWSIVERG